MFGFKGAKDRLIEHLEAELDAERKEISSLSDENSQLAGELASARKEISSLSDENSQLAGELASARRGASAGGEEKNRRAVSRFMGDRCRDLTVRSLRNAVLKDPKRNLVAEMPPPGAVPSGTTTLP